MSQLHEVYIILKSFSYKIYIQNVHFRIKPLLILLTINYSVHLDWQVKIEQMKRRDCMVLLLCLYKNTAHCWCFQPLSVCLGHECYVVQFSRGRVKDCDSCGEEAVLISGGLGSKAPVTHQRGWEGQESVCWVTGVLHDFSSPYIAACRCPLWQ